MSPVFNSNGLHRDDLSIYLKFSVADKTIEARGASVARDCFVVLVKSALPILQCVTPQLSNAPVTSR
eukprot:3667246-Pleurochrysis_carterae.AAC.5